MSLSGIELDFRYWLMEVIACTPPVELGFIDPHARRTSMTLDEATRELEIAFDAHRNGIVNVDYVWGRPVKTSIDLNVGSEATALDGARYDAIFGEGKMARIVSRARAKQGGQGLTLIQGGVQ